MRRAIQGGPGGVRILQTVPVEGTAAEMAADAAAIILAGTEVANQGKRWENTTDGLVYDFRPVGGVWDYYLEPNVDADGRIPVSATLSNLATTLGLYTPARDFYAQWALGADDVWGATLVTTVEKELTPIDARYISTEHRTLLVICKNASTLYDLDVYFGRNSDPDEAGITGAVVTAITDKIKVINIPASEGYAPWIHVKMTATHATADALLFKVVLLGRGG